MEESCADENHEEVDIANWPLRTTTVVVEEAPTEESREEAAQESSIEEHETKTQDDEGPWTVVDIIPHGSGLGLACIWGISYLLLFLLPLGWIALFQALHSFVQISCKITINAVSTIRGTISSLRAVRKCSGILYWCQPSVTRSRWKEYERHKTICCDHLARYASRLANIAGPRRLSHLAVEHSKRLRGRNAYLCRLWWRVHLCISWVDVFEENYTKAWGERMQLKGEVVWFFFDIDGVGAVRLPVPDVRTATPEELKEVFPTLQIWFHWLRLKRGFREFIFPKPLVRIDKVWVWPWQSSQRRDVTEPRLDAASSRRRNNTKR